MQPLSHDIRSYYRKHATGEVVSETGAVTETYTVDGPYSLAFRPTKSGGEARSLGEQGYNRAVEQFYVIADGCKCFRSGDTLTTDRKGLEPVYQIENVATWPTEQTFYVRGL